jgi:hypothetical protein
MLVVNLRTYLYCKPLHIGWRNRFLGSLNVYKYGLWVSIRNFIGDLDPAKSIQIRIRLFRSKPHLNVDTLWIQNSQNCVWYFYVYFIS